MRKNVLYLLGLFAATAVLHSCVDKDYDLDDIDTTISTDADLTLPTSSTGDILLRNIMEEGDIVKFVDNGNGQRIYAVVQDGTADIQQIDIPEIRISPTPRDIDATIQLNPTSGANAARKKVHVHVGVLDIDIPDANFEYTIKASDNASFNIDETSADVDPVVRGLQHATAKSPVTVIVNLNISGLPTMLKRVYLDNMTMEIPSELEVSSCQFMGNEIALNSIVNGLIPLTGTDAVVELENGSNKTPIALILTATGINLNGDDITFKANPNASVPGKISMKGKFDVGGTFRLNTADIDANELETYLTAEGAGLVAQIAAQNSLRPLFEASPVHIQGTSTISSIVIGSMTGDIARALSDIEPIYLDNLPDFLNDPNVVLDLDNPVILLNTTSNIPAVANTALTLTSQYTSGSPVTVNVPAIGIPGSYQGTETHFSISDKTPTIWPTGYSAATTTALEKAGSVRELIRRIPKQVNVAADSVRLHIEDMDITRSYNVDVNYQIFAPLVVGPDFQLVYSDTEREWADDLDDVEDLDAKALVLNAKVTSSLPAALTLSLIPIDSEARAIPELIINDVTVEPNANRQDITFTLQPANGHTLNDVLAGRNGVHQLDGVQYKATIKSRTPGEQFYETAKIKLDDIKLTIKGGITYKDDDK